MIEAGTLEEVSCDQECSICHMRERKDGCRGQEAGKRTGKYGGMKMNREKIRPKKGVALKQNGERERERRCREGWRRETYRVENDDATESVFKKEK